MYASRSLFPLLANRLFPKNRTEHAGSVKLAAMDEAAVVEMLREAVPDVVAVYVFGSAVTGEMHAQSDVDLAFLPPRGPLPAFERFTLQERVAAAIGCSVDLVDLRSASTVMRMQVVSKGRLLYESDPDERGRFEDYAFSSYVRLNEERRAILEQIRREGSVYGR